MLSNPNRQAILLRRTDSLIHHDNQPSSSQAFNMTKSNSEFLMPYQRQGQGDTLILLHGALADPRLWAPHQAALAKSYDVIVPCLRHFGETQPAPGSFGLNTHARDLLTLLDHLALERVHLVAWSYGADVALNAATLAPQRFASLCLCDPGFPGYLEDESMAEFGADAQAMFEPVFPLAAEARWPEAVRQLIDGSGGAPGYFDRQPEAVRQQQLDNAGSLDLQLHQNETPNLTAETLADLDIPTTIARGENTRPLFRVVCNAALGYLPRSRKVILADANHMLPVEAPERFVALIDEHLEALPD